MIVERYDPVNLFALVPKLALAMDPELAELDRLLEDDALVQQVKADLARRAPRSLTRGRRSPAVEVILRMLVVRRLYDWSYARTEQFVADSLVLRQFCRLYLAPAPDDTTLIRWAGLIGPATLAQLNAHVVALAHRLKVTRGRKLRSDGTVVETTIRYPRDSTLLSDSVRVVSRLVKRAKAVLGDGVPRGAAIFRDRTRSAQRLARQIGDAARRLGEVGKARRRAAYQRLLRVAAASLRQAAAVRERLGTTSDRVRARLVRELDRVAPLVTQVITQTRRRVLHGEAVPATQKLVSLFEPHTAIIRRGKAGKPTEFGRKVWLDELDGGIISRCVVLDGNPPDAQQLGPSLAAHRRRFGHPPDLVATDRGGYSPENERTARALGVRRIALPQPGAKSPERSQHERQGWFRRAQRFRAGVEGRISVLRRRGYLGRCRAKGDAGFGRWVGWGVLTANLSTIARIQAARR